MCYVGQDRLFFSNETPIRPGEDDRNRLGYGPEGYLTLSGGAAETEMKVEVKGPKEGPYPNARSVDNEDGNGGC
ncbi:hypothetical protein G6F43_014303 [Rhizopus delemar]|nr:hypothetical protein G6F43_014303 [Rhizopus delemar]